MNHSLLRFGPGSVAGRGSPELQPQWNLASEKPYWGRGRKPQSPYGDISCMDGPTRLPSPQEPNRSTESADSCNWDCSFFRGQTLSCPFHPPIQTSKWSGENSTRETMMIYFPQGTVPQVFFWQKEWPAHMCVYLDPALCRYLFLCTHIHTNIGLAPATLTHTE